MERGSILEHHGEHHIQVNGDLLLTLPLMLDATAAAAADAAARCVHSLSPNPPNICDISRDLPQDLPSEI